MNKAPLLWVNILVFSITGLIALTAVPYYAIEFGFSAFAIVATILCLGYCGMSITAGYHRLWSHKTYDAHWSIKLIYAIGGAFALQNSILHWCSDHRNHHRFVDNNEKDPYSAKKGFWYSHIGWMLREQQGHQYDNYKNVKDLQKDKIVMWQHKYYLPLSIVTNFGIPLLLGLFTGEVVGMLLSVGVLRLVLSHHFTFFINSLAHIWGKQTYSDIHTARDNGFLALLTYGEGYHNFHHTFEYDYRNGIKWWQFDPTKWFIKTASLMGLTKNLRTAPDERIEKAKAAHKMALFRAHIEKLPQHSALLNKIEADYDLLIKTMGDFYAAKKRLIEIKKRKMNHDYKKTEVYRQVEEFKTKLQQRKDAFRAYSLHLAI